MKTIKVGDHVKAALTSKHAGHTGTVLNADGNFLTVQCAPDVVNPLSYKSKLYPGVKVFQLARHLTIILKDKK